MSLTVAELDELARGDAEQALEACCGARAWIAGMLARRPFGSFAAVLRASDEVARQLSAADWLEAFAHHPRIGEQRAAAAVPARASAWSSSEQASAATAPPDVAGALAAANREYEEQFGFIFLICASGRSADEILAALEARLDNDRETELRVAAEEQQKITRLRLARLLTSGREGRG